VIALLGIATLNGVCRAGACTFVAPGDITIVTIGTPEALFAIGTLVVVNGVLLSGKGGRALIKMLFR